MSFATFNVLAQEDSAIITDLDYPEIVPPGSLVDVELSVEYHLNSAGYLNPHILDGDWYDFFSSIVAETCSNVTGLVKKVTASSSRLPRKRTNICIRLR